MSRRVDSTLQIVLIVTFHSTRAATYKVFINTLKGLPRTKLDAAFGITGLVSLYAIRWICDRLSKRYPSRGLSSKD